MYHNIAASIRSKVLLRGSSSSLATSFVALPLNYPNYNAPSHQASLSMSMFATVGSASGDGSSSSSNEQRRPFWATRPIENEATTTTKTPPNPSINTVDHSLNAAAASAGISMDDIKKAVTKAKKPDSLESIVKGAPKKTAAKPKKAKKEKEEEDNDEEEEVEDEDEATVDDEEEEEDIKLPPHPDSITPTYMAKVIAAKHKKHAVTAALAKRIIDDIFDMVIDGVVEKKDVRIPRLGVFTKVVQKSKTLTHIQTKEKYTVPAKYRVTFKTSSTLRKKVGELELPADTKK